VSWNWLEWFKTPPRELERSETLSLLYRVRQRQKESPFTSDEAIAKFCVDIIDEACVESRGTIPGMPFGRALYGLTKDLLHHESMIGELPDPSEMDSITLEEGVRYRAAFKRHERFLEAHTRLLPMWRGKLLALFQGLIEYFPESAFTEVNEDGTADDDSIVLPEAHAFDLCENLPELIFRTMRTFFDDDITQAHLFEPLREQFDRNLCYASGVNPNERFERPPKLILPTDSKIKEPSALVDAYLADTGFQRFFYRPLPFTIPFPARFEHTHIVGGTGHGKTQLMQFLIHHDLVRSREDGRSVVVIDSQGDLIRTISHLDYWSEPSFRERFVLVDPNDVEHPVCLNMFDFNRDRLSGYAPVDREKILNATIELYGYFFGALLGAELTQRQGLIFKYLARLLIEIPDATIHTLRELMEDGGRFRPYMEKLTGTARSFFATQFFEHKFGETKKQILTRLWGVLSNSSIERMFSHKRNRIDVFELLNQGKVILINTAKELLGQDGAAIFGRFFIALITQAAVQRAAMPPHTRRPGFVYIDEAQDYFDDNISHLLNQARKYRVGLIFAHQNLDQLGAGLRSSVLASTTIKFAGGVSAKDANVLDSEFRCDSSFLLGQKKQKTTTEFACYVKNFTGRALSISIPLGFVESRAQISRSDYEDLIDENRELYSEPPMVPEDAPFPGSPAPKPPKNAKRAEPIRRREEVEEYDEPEEPRPAPQPAPQQRTERPRGPPPQPEPPQPGRGGRQHKYVQQLVKLLAEERGFRATIEETILDGAGRVDVSLVRNGIKVACQVSVTTTKDWELGGIEKCLAAGYQEVVLVGSSDRHIKAFSKFIEENLDPKEQGRVRYVTSETLVDYLNEFGKPAPTEDVVRGYKVRTTQQSVDSKEATSRRKAITEVIARSLKASKSDL
jgi:hypothetical protein